MNDLCYEHSQDGVLLNSFGCVFVQKEVRCSSKIEIKVGLQYTKEKLSLPGNTKILLVQFDESCRLSFGEHLFQGIIFSGCFQN